MNCGAAIMPMQCPAEKSKPDHHREYLRQSIGLWVIVTRWNLTVYSQLVESAERKEHTFLYSSQPDIGIN